ncbi:MAG: hypothetical protein ABIF71_10515 [Planctomycetota bacterium]
MTRKTKIDFDCEFYRVKQVNEGQIANGRRTTQSVIYHLCTFNGQNSKDRCDLNDCPKRKRTMKA